MDNNPLGNLPGGGPENPEKRSKLFSGILSLVMVALMISLLWSALKVDGKKTDDEYYQVIAYFDEGKVTEYSLNLGTRKLTYVLEGEEEKRTYTVPSYELFVADTHETVREYNKNHPDNPIKMNYESGSSNYWITQMLPMAGMLIMMGLMLYWLVKKMGNTVLDDTRRSMAFGKARLKTGDDGRKTTFDDVAGLDEEKEDLQEIVEFLRNPGKFDDLGARIPKGVLLVGPPGTGKTLLARAVAGEADATFLSISGSDFVEMYVGVGASRVRDLFDNAKKNIPSIVFIDEIDAVGRQRGAGMGGGHDEREQTLNQLLVEMDGFGKNAGVIIMAATNRPDILDPALLRPGRFDRQVTVNYPDVNGREAILKVHARNKPIGPDVRLDEIARATSGFTGADLENLLNEAALLAARRGKKALTKLEIEEATIKVVVGTEKRSKKIADDEKRLTAYHEAGHAVTNFYLDTLDPVHQVSIIPRGMAGGYTMSLPKDDRSYVSKKHMLDELVSLLGGRVAEAIILGDISTGASNDIERATSIARSMVVKYGMSDKLGPISYGSGNEEVFIGRDYGHMKNYSEDTAAAIDKEIESIIMQAYERCAEILRLHIDKLHLLANYLIEYEKIDGLVFTELMTDPDFSVKQQKKKTEAELKEKKAGKKKEKPDEQPEVKTEEKPAEKQSDDQGDGTDSSEEKEDPEPEKEEKKEEKPVPEKKDPVPVKKEPIPIILPPAFDEPDPDYFSDVDIDELLQEETADYMEYLQDEEELKESEITEQPAESETKPETEPETDPETETVSETGTFPEQESASFDEKVDEIIDGIMLRREEEKAASSSEADAEPEVAPETETDADPEAEPETETETQPAAEEESDGKPVVKIKSKDGSKFFSFKAKLKKDKPHMKITPVIAEAPSAESTELSETEEKVSSPIMVTPVEIPSVPVIPTDFDIDPALLYSGDENDVNREIVGDVEKDPNAEMPAVPKDVEIDPTLLPGGDEPKVEASPEPLFGSGFAELDEEKDSTSMSDENALLVPDFLDDDKEETMDEPSPVTESYVGDMVFYGPQTEEEPVEEEAAELEEVTEPELVVEEPVVTEPVKPIEVPEAAFAETETEEVTEPETIPVEEPEVTESVEPVEVSEEKTEETETVEPEAVEEPATVAVNESEETETSEPSDSGLGFSNAEEFAANNDAIYELYELLKAARDQDDDKDGDPFNSGKK